MSTEDYYKTLGVEETSTKEEIKKAFRKMSILHHPDKNGNTEESIKKFQQLNEAYEILGDERKRLEYDNRNNEPNIQDILNMFMGGEQVFAGMPGMMFGMGPMGPMGIHVMSGGMPNQMPSSMPCPMMNQLQRPPPIVKHLEVTLDDIMNGTTLEVNIERWVMHQGHKQYEQALFSVPLPQGVDDNEILIFRGHGHIINPSLKGDVKIMVKTKPHDFRRDHLDLILDKTVSLKEALCGEFSFVIKLNGKTYTLANHKGSIIAPEFRKIYPNMGICKDGQTGNLIIHFHVQFPQTLTFEQIDQIKTIL